METIHATCVARRGRGVLLRGPSGAGKSSLALALIDRGWMLVADDRVALAARDGALFAAPHPTLAGLLEIRGLGIVRPPHLLEARLALVVDLVEEVERVPEAASIDLAGVVLPRADLSGGARAAPRLERWLATIPI